MIHRLFTRGRKAGSRHLTEVPGRRVGRPSPWFMANYRMRLRNGTKMQIKKGYKQLLAEAEAQIETLTVEQAIAEHGRDNVVFVDLRDPREMDREGKMPGAFACTRGMLEFWIDPESPYAKPVFADPKRFVFFFAGG